MAFYNKIGSLMRQNVSKTVVSNGQPSMFNAIRCMSSKLFVGGLSYQTDDHNLKEAFSSFGEVTEARVITDRESGRSRGFGFVNYDTNESANEAMKAMDGQELNGRSIRVSLATERPPRIRTSLHMRDSRVISFYASSICLLNKLWTYSSKACIFIYGRTYLVGCTDVISSMSLAIAHEGDFARAHLNELVKCQDVLV
ncbi:glycine-rich RNA-binding protein 4 [Artemisia annua]|uniref:Glycine-rich RNA-binding protein 4 n=1 Tax=Artemisia annua TaxID=35608 RepID=A0A2U1PCT6_ARTAN|nr:glycine-rich RNA-binding protein 4 [Artemisia annua]